MNAPAPLLEVRDLRKWYDDRAAASFRACAAM